MAPRKRKAGYYAICFGKNRDGTRNEYYIHRLVAKAFIPNPDNKPQIDHINTIRTDNRVCNLRWVTASENHYNPISLKRFEKIYKSDDFKNNSIKVINEWNEKPEAKEWIVKLHEFNEIAVVGLPLDKSKPTLRYPSASIASKETGGYFNRAAISHCLNKRYGLKKNIYRGYIWYRADALPNI